MLQLKPISLRRQGATRRPMLLSIPSTLVLAVLLTTTRSHGAVASVPAKGPAGSSSVTTGPLRIEIASTIDDAAMLSAWILERDLDVAKSVPPVEGHEHWISVEIGGVTYDYEVSVVTVRDGAPLGPVRTPEACECNGEALLAMIDDRIAAAAEELRAYPNEGEAPSVAASTLPSHGPSTDVPPPRVGVMGSVGIGIAVLGAGLLGSGVPLALRPDENREGAGGIIETRSTHGLGLGMAVVGGAAVLAGLSLHVVDLVRRRQRAVAVVPMLGPERAGLVAAWRFQGRLAR